MGATDQSTVIPRRAAVLRWVRFSPVEVWWEAQIQGSFLGSCLELVQLLDRLLAHVVELGDGVVQARDVLLLQVLGALGHHLWQCTRVGFGVEG